MDKFGGHFSSVYWVMVFADCTSALQSIFKCSTTALVGSEISKHKQNYRTNLFKTVSKQIKTVSILTAIVFISMQFSRGLLMKINKRKD